MNKIMFEMGSWELGTYQFYANINEDNIVEYEIDKRFHIADKAKEVSRSGKLDRDKSYLFIDFIEKADIRNINDLVEEKCFSEWVRTDYGSFSITTFKYGNASWNDYEELENMHYIYLAISLCDEDMADVLLGYQDNLSSDIKDAIKGLGLKIKQDD